MARNPTQKQSISSILSFVEKPQRTVEELTSCVGRDVKIERAIARHDHASPELLARFAHSSDRATRAAVVRNPNTPSVDYLRLDEQLPKEFLANPLLDLLMLENPALLEQLLERLLVRVLRREACPEDVLVWASECSRKRFSLR